MSDPDASFCMGNHVCGDDICVYMTIQSGIITQRSFDGNTSMITTASASFFSEVVENIGYTEILTRNKDIFTQHDFMVSPRRFRALVIPLLTTQNALHQWMGNDILWGFDRYE